MTNSNPSVTFASPSKRKRLIEVYVTGTIYKQISILMTDNADFVFRNTLSLNCTSRNPHYDYVLSTNEDFKHARPVLDYSLRSKVDQYKILREHLDVFDRTSMYFDSFATDVMTDAKVYLLPTFRIINFHNNGDMLCDQLSSLWENIESDIHYDDKRVVIQCADSANGWAHICAPYELAESVLHDAFHYKREKLVEIYGTNIVISDTRADMSECGSFLTARAIIRPHLTSIHSEYRVIFSKDSEGNLDRSFIRKRRRVDIGNGYFQANLTAHDISPAQEIQTSEISDKKLNIQLSDVEIDKQPRIKDLSKTLSIPELIYEMRSTPIDKPRLREAVASLMPIIPHWFGAIDLAVTTTGHIIILEFSPEFGTKYMDTMEIQKAAKQAFRNYITYLDKQKESQ